ncbi:MAG TPA: hypothetical protein VLM40_17450, partial [Gemmata sp.]|nr:hypothetical protein [Gemmata sp.]
MTSRERTLAIVLVGGIVLCGGALLGYMFLYVPLQEKATQAETLDSEIADLDSKISSINRVRPQIAEVKRQSLPPDIDRAKLQYQQMLELLRPTGLPSPADFTVKFVRESVKKPPLTPVIAPNRPAYTQLEFNVDIENANIWKVVDFLYKFYQLDLLHRITELKIARANKPSDTRDRLKVNVTCEAIILDGVEPRSTLFPITNVVAAVGGFASIEAILQKNELLEKFTPHSTSPVLATRNRDYSLIARYDPFYGLLPDLPPEPPFSIAKVPDVVINQTDEAPQPVRVKLVGKGSSGASLKAEVKDGTLVPKGSIAVDPKTMTIALPKVSAELGSSASSTIAVVATSAEGETTETTFKVLMGKSPPAKLGPDISAAIKFIMITGSSEGSI